MEPTEFLTTFQNYASCNWSYLLLNFSTEYHNFSTKILWFVPFLSNFGRCHSFSFKKQRDLDLVSVWECQLVLVFILNYHSKWFSNRWNGKTEEKSGGWQYLLLSVIWHTTFWTLFPQLSYLNWFQKQMSK